jgi:spore germination cell wall hydrolase CwlJ-like protein
LDDPVAEEDFTRAIEIDPQYAEPHKMRGVCRVTSKKDVKGALADLDRALTCLTQAVYYEAASEGVDGGRAVAQVVLNRMRHPGYPASVCGVVYQGADRPTGCQFTFTCDGSLLRAPVQALWARSRKIAEEALKGRVFATVGHATHYHADYVLP